LDNRVGAVKKILDRLFHSAGPADGSDGLVPLRGFGKLPNYLEYQHLEDSTGLGRDFQEWVVAGHQHWVQVVPPQERGRMQTADLTGFLGKNQDEVVVARLWHSRDSANPPRQFPFTFFVTIPRARWADDPLDQLIRSSRLWASLQIAFDRQHLIYERGGTFQRFYRDQRIDIEFEDGADETTKVVAAASAIPGPAWLESASESCVAKDARGLMGVLKALAAQWNECRDCWPPGGVRLPLSSLFRVEVQAAAWLRWLEVNVKRPLPVGGTLISYGPGGRPDSLALLSCPFVEEDFLLITESAEHCERTEDVRHLAPSADREPAGDEQVASAVDILPAGEYSLWDWANMSLMST
jgi:hypothetical protein